MPKNTLITNAVIVNEGSQYEADLLISNGRIERIGSQLSAAEATTVIDAEGRWLLPGMIDDQVHFREPGLTHKGDIGSESAAAVAGGITSFMEMPNTNPQTINLDALEAKYRIGAEKSLANYAFYLGASNDNLGQIRQLQANQTCGIKIFMGASTGNMLVDDEQILDRIFRDAPCPITTHCESTPIIQANLERAIARWGKQIPIEEHPRIRSREACLASTRLAMELAQRHQAQLHILHISTADEVAMFEPGPLEGKSITGEACLHFLHFSEEDYAALGNWIKCNPAIKGAHDRAAIIAGLADGRLNIVATDHAPHTIEEKESGDYLTAPAGLPLVQYALPALLEMVTQQHLSIEEAIYLSSHNIAQRFKIVDRGYIREGCWADLVIAESGGDFPVDQDTVLSRCGWTPFRGRSFSWRIHTTLVNGVVAWSDRQVNPGSRGQRLEYDRS